MIPLRDFNEFKKDGIVKQIKPDLSRAKSLIQDSLNRESFVRDMIKKLGISDKNANYYVENVYDVLIELIRAKMFMDGLKSSGEGAHEAEVMYMKELGFEDNDIRAVNKLRFNRNQIKYYGKSLNQTYSKRVIELMEKLMPRLKNKANT